MFANLSRRRHRWSVKTSTKETDKQQRKYNWLLIISQLQTKRNEIPPNLSLPGENHGKENVRFGARKEEVKQEVEVHLKLGSGTLLLACQQ